MSRASLLRERLARPGLLYRLAFAAALMHLENLVWYGALIVACGVFYQRFARPAWVAGLATALYAFDHAHAGPVAWIANRNAIASACFGVLAVIWHDRAGARSQGPAV